MTDSSSLPSPSEYAHLWPIDPQAVYLNHGSFGACPSYVLERQSYYRQQMERHPIRFLIRELPALVEAARERLAAFVHASPADLVFVPNATAGVNTVFRSLRLSPGDEILITNHIYGACRKAAAFVCEQSGATLVEANYDFPMTSPDLITEAVLEKVSPRTRLALIDHITSATGIIQPVHSIVKALEAKGIDTLVDGAHSPGSIDLNVSDIGAAYYTANCHKWLCAPKNAAILVVRKDRQKDIFPLIISHAGHHEADFPERFYWPGTTDFTPALCTVDAIDYLSGLLPGGWPAILRRNHDLCIEGRNLLCRTLGITAPCPDEMLASMATLPLPDPPRMRLPDYKSTDALQNILYYEFGIEIPVMYWSSPPRRFLRISTQLYNSFAQYEYLAEKLKIALAMEANTYRLPGK